MLKNLKYLSFAMLGFIFLISINIIAVFNSKFIFEYFAVKNNLSIMTNLPHEEILLDYNRIIDYVMNPLIQNLNFKNFTISQNGQMHFFDVKVIFTILCIISLATIMFLLTYIIYKRFFYDKTKLMSRINGNLVTLRNYFNGLILGFLVFITSFIIIDFTKIFNLMHKALFSNDYWIFNEVNDSIITILPESFFMLCAVSVIILLIVETIIINVSVKNKIN
ncbi:TIGR01906 family membrane protein [uncultured Clostridium sp.]|uniref:TIGR01906 family membrane protein n=1 Tax=uncultured Clostridium sp. TaxID=59620 RepID=UPI002625FEFB|nr:TIGR01906 family membrane protein [uncultured Clostridium sp.]